MGAIARLGSATPRRAGLGFAVFASAAERMPSPAGLKLSTVTGSRAGRTVTDRASGPCVVTMIRKGYKFRLLSVVRLMPVSSV